MTLKLLFSYCSAYYLIHNVICTSSTQDYELTRYFLLKFEYSKRISYRHNTIIVGTLF